MEKLYQILILHRIKKILKSGSLATYKLQKVDLVQRLNTYFWDEVNGLDGFWNKKIYKKQVRLLGDAIRNNGHTLESCRNNLAEILNIRTDELVTHLINQDLLRADNDTPPSYYIVYISMLRFFVLFKWVIVQVIFMGLLVAIVANLISDYIWKALISIN